MNLGPESFLLIITAEAVAACLLIVALVLLTNRKLRRLLKKSQANIKALREKHHNEPEPEPIASPIEYSEYLDQQLEITKDHHYSLGSRQDIALDLDPNIALPRKTAALRHAILIAEKEATAKGNNAVQWDFLASRYQQLLSFTEDYTDAKPSKATEDTKQTIEELTQTKERINSLEKFKALYLELEERWARCQNEASEQLSELKTIIGDSTQAKGIEELLERYHLVYSEVGTIIERGAKSEISSSPEEDEKHSVELQQLRHVAADQHRIIAELKDKLQNADNTEEQIAVVENLQGELQKQARFLQESETCIQLMEDELDSSKAELAQLHKKLAELPETKALVEDLQEVVNRNEGTIDSLKSENRRLTKQLALAQEPPPEDNNETRKV